MRYVCIVIPPGNAEYVLHTLQTSKNIGALSKFDAEDGTHINFRIIPKNLQEVLIQLTKIGCGESYGQIDVFDSIISRPVLSKEKHFDNNGRRERSYKISDRMTMDEIEVWYDD